MLTRDFPFLEVWAGTFRQGGVIASTFRTCKDRLLRFRVNANRSEFTVQSTTFPCFGRLTRHIRPSSPYGSRRSKGNIHIMEPCDTTSAEGECVKQAHSNLTGKIPMNAEPSSEQSYPFIIFSHSKPHINFFLAILQTSWMNT